MKKPLIAFATERELPDLTEDDRRAVKALADRGIDAQAAVWDDTTLCWSDFSAVVLRSTHDYFKKMDLFRAWLTSLESAQVPVFNSLPILRWNLDKSYLRDLEANGIPLPPTRWVTARGAAAALKDFQKTGWKEGVLKAVQSANGDRTVRLSEKSTLNEIPSYAPDTGLILQRFLPSIVAEGETSLIYLDGKFSHAVLKRPARGEFRVQYAYGGTAQPLNPGDDALALGDRVMARIQGDPLYGRVDLARDEKGRWVLMELELLEPTLYFSDGPGSESRFAEALKNRLSE